MRRDRPWTVAAAATLAAALSVAAGPTPTAAIEKPKPRAVTGGTCRILSDSTLSASWGPGALPALAFTVGPGAAMAEAMHANTTKFTGPGTYKNEIVALYLGKTALEDSYGGLGTVVIAADGHSGTFALNDGTASGRFDCGAPPAR